MRTSFPLVVPSLVVLALGACGREAPPTPVDQPARGVSVAVTDTVVDEILEAAGTAQPLRVATLSTRLMGTVTAVLVREGEHVTAGQVLVQLDARDLDAKRAQVDAALAGAAAVHQDAVVQAARMRALYADSAATRAQLDQAETGLARAEAAVAGAKGMAAELAASASYAEVHAPFAGVVTRRFVDPGAFAAPGAPLATVEDASTLRVSASAAPDAVRGLRRGSVLQATIGDTTVRSTVEGIVPGGANLYTINALVPNAAGRLLSGSAATLGLPRGTRRAILVPAGAIVREGSLTGVRATSAGHAALRWVRLGGSFGGLVEALAGLSPGDSVLVNDGET